MSANIGFDSQTPSLPKGGGAVSGLGETFAPDLSTGTGSYVISLDFPNGPNDIGPRLSLRYGTASGNGPFGFGFIIPLVRLVRSTSRGFPHYDASDTILLEGVGELVALGGGAYRPQVDGGAWRVQPSGDGFRLIDREGLYYYLGVSPDACLTGSGGVQPNHTSRIYAWHLERIEDTLGNTVTFSWLRDNNQLYLSSVQYGVYRIKFNYQSRPDTIRWGRAGFLIITSLRCASIELRLESSPQPLLRRWNLSYTQDETSGSSLLTGIILTGFDENGVSMESPSLNLGYSSFKIRALTRFHNLDNGTSPGLLTNVGNRMELVDWDGDGLPDLLEIYRGGQARIWPNVGNCTWGRPRIIGNLPLFASFSSILGFADMDGDGIADLIRLNRPIDGYLPHIPGGGLGRPVAWRNVPSVSLITKKARLVDLDGDGIVDLLSSSSEYLTLYYRSETEGWDLHPQLVPRSEVGEVDLTDPHIFLADMTGDGSYDLVRVDGGGVTFQQYLGRGRWSARVMMDNPPTLPFNVKVERLFLSDVDGDGCADLIYLDDGRVIYWINQGGNRFASPQTIDYVPTGQISEVRMADMCGSGTAGLLWSSRAPFRREPIYYYLDFTGNTKPYLLNKIDNGMGLVTEVTYGSSAVQASDDASNGQPWSTILPVVVPVVTRVTKTDMTTRNQRTTIYRYHEGRYDGILREFCGFGRVDEDMIGDETIATLRTTSWFHVGVDPNSQEEPRTVEERRRLRGIRGRLHRQMRHGLDGSLLQAKPYDSIEQEWTVINVDTSGGNVIVPRLVKKVSTSFERMDTPACVITTTNMNWDEFQNVIDSIESSTFNTLTTNQKVLRTITQFAHDPNGRFISRTWRVQQFDAVGTILTDTITEYDGAPEGTTSTMGLVTRRSSLVLTDMLVADVYGNPPPDLVSLGYFRRHNESGWWVVQAAYRRQEDNAGLHGMINGPRGATTKLDFDVNKTYPVRITDPRGNTVVAEHDYRVCRVQQLTDGTGLTYSASFDPLARTIASVEPGDMPALPTLSYDYVTSAIPIRVTERRRAISGAIETIDIRETFDGSGRLLERRVQDDIGEIAIASFVYGARGLVAKAYTEYRPGSLEFSPPNDTQPHTLYNYDALGRLTTLTKPDGSKRKLTYEPLMIEEADEEDNRTGVGALHASTPTRRWLDPTGRISSIQQNLGGRWITSTYEYDVKGNMIIHADALGNTVRMSYDLLGRLIAVERPEHSTITLFDAAGNPIEARNRGGSLILREFDECNRPTKVRYNSLNAAPVISFVYHDSGRPAPLEAGAHTTGGRCVRIDDEAGTRVFDYDERGRISLRRFTYLDGSHAYDLNFTYRSDSQIDSVVYPKADHSGSLSRMVIRYEYDKRGHVTRIPSVVEGMEYNLAGRRTRVRYVNGLEQTIAYNELTQSLASMSLSGPHGILRSTSYNLDLVGNLLRIDSPDPKFAATYNYDDLYRLIDANTANAENWTYSYDDAGNILHKSDIGDYRYGENGFPATCLTSAGSQTFRYTLMGEMANAPWGTHTFDPAGRMIHMVLKGGTGDFDFRYDYAGKRVVAKGSKGDIPVLDLVTPDPFYSIESGRLVLNIIDVQGAVVARQPAAGGSMNFLHRDHLGGLAIVTDSSGILIDSLRYDPFGRVLERSGTSSIPLVPLGFTGGVPEPSSGLIYLNARYYQPALGCFITSDPIVKDVFDPILWLPYVYCGNNPTTYVDPSGRSFWGIFLAVVALVALAVISIVTFGATAPLLAVGIGVVAGGIVGGLAAAKHGGNFDDIITGVLVGAAVGGWGAFAGYSAGVAAMTAASNIGIHGALLGAVAGGVSGAVSGAAMGFASGFAGGKGSIGEILNQMLQGALVGLVMGAALGALSYAKEPAKGLGTELTEHGQSWSRPTTPTGPDPDLQSRALISGGDPSVHTYTGATGRILGEEAGKLGGIVAPHTAAALAPLAGSIAVQTLVVDVAAGLWDLYIEDVKSELRRSGTNLGPFNFLTEKW